MNSSSHVVLGMLAALLVTGCATDGRTGLAAIAVSSGVVAGQACNRIEGVSSDGLSRTILTPGFADAHDPDVSFDGSRVVFAGRRSAGGDEGIHEIDLASGRILTRFESRGRFHSPRHAAGGSLVFLWNTTGKSPDRRAGVLFCLPPGATPQRLTFHRDLDLSPLVAPDGRVIFGLDGQDGLMAVNWDGSEVGSYTEPAGPAGSRPAIPLEPVCWLDDGAFLLARAQTRSALFKIPAHNRYYQLLPAAGPDAPGPQTPLAPRPEPFFQPTILEPRRSVGEVFCFDARKGAGMGPVPTEPREWPVVRIHVFAHASATSLEGQEKTAGREVGLAPDGSFHAWVPADRGLRFELVSRGKVVRSMRRTVWLRPGEKRGCLGCHDRHGLAPPNRVPLALYAPPDKVVAP